MGWKILIHFSSEIRILDILCYLKTLSPLLLHPENPALLLNLDHQDLLLCPDNPGLMLHQISQSWP